MRRSMLVGTGLALVIVASSGTASATSQAGLHASGLLTQVYGLFMLPTFEPGTLALLGSGVFGLVGMARRRRERQGL